jgi:hypothetical protein
VEIYRPVLCRFRREADPWIEISLSRNFADESSAGGFDQRKFLQTIEGPVPPPGSRRQPDSR